MASKDLEVSVDVAARPSRVWELVRDVGRMGEWSPECRKVFVWRRGGQVREGSWLTGINKNGWAVWPSNSRVYLYEEERAIGWKVVESGARWSYHLTPYDGGTHVSERRELPDGKPWIARIFVRAALGGDDAHDRSLRRGMTQTLERIKAEAEAAERAG